MKASDILEQAAGTYRERNAVYGDNYLVVGEVLNSLFPKGIALHGQADFLRFHIFMLMVVKMTRYCNNWDAGGHQDSIRDNTVYSAMLEEIDARLKEAEKDA